ncbi:MAG: 2-oxo acid dehydrogenase subunit E2 [Alphaproteobacteria bacterium]|nr:2-oxo acid dehydrogenase subunit E2 [Alphaproteobacteria bacterium]
MGVFRMPSLGADMEAGKLVEWLKRAGDAIAAGDVIAVVETQKGAIEVEAFESGIVESHLVAVGQTVPVGTPLAMIRGEGTAAAPAAGPAAVPVPQIAPSPAAPPLSGAPQPPAFRASPAARRFAAEHAIELTGMRGSGPDGAIVFVDVEQALQGRRDAAPAAPPRPPPTAAGPPATGMAAMRQAIAAAMERSKREIPHYYVAHAADVTAAFDALAAFNATRAPRDRVLFGAALLGAVARALARFPEFNGFHRGGAFEPAPRIHVGMAIALRGGGLVAPAIHDADKLALPDLMRAMHDLADRVRAGRFRSSEIADPTITLTSLGERGVDAVLGVIYPPQVAIVGAGTPALRPWVVDGAVVARRLCRLTLAADHRVSDGHRGALFLAEVARLAENPELP